MHQETQSELFIRTLSDMLNDMRFHRYARQRDRNKAEADHFMTSFGVFKTSATPPAHPAQTRG